MSYQFYVYVYLDTRKPGKFSYWENGFGIDFDYEPFYIGKGTGDRLYKHLNIDNSDINNIKKGKIQHILDLGLEPIIYKICETNDDQFAYDIERLLVLLIGRINKKNGPLSNLTEGGRCGDTFTYHPNKKQIRLNMSIAQSGKTYSNEYKLNMSLVLTGRIITWGDKISEAKKDMNFTEEHKEKLSIAQKDKPIIECPFCGKKGKSRMKKFHFYNCKENPVNKNRDFKSERKNKPYKKIICPHCSLEGTISMMKRWHFDNCKENPNNRYIEIKTRVQLTCPFCGISGCSHTMKRWHFDNCKFKPNF